jgi:dsDNA-binding SOS-regulon protein
MTVVEPLSATRCSIRRTLYTTKPEAKVSDQMADLEKEFYSMVRQLEDQFKQIRTDEKGVMLSPAHDELQMLIQTHLRKEREAGRKIKPALPLQISREVNGSDCGIAEKRT